MKIRSIISAFSILTLAVSVAAIAAETITYTYDAKGRLIKVVHSGTVNNGITTDYNHDKADNRTKVKVVGAAS